MSALYSLLVVAHESHQHATAAEVLDVYRVLLRRADADRRDQMLADVQRMKPLLEELPRSLLLERARERLRSEVAALRAYSGM